jgi:hypothetical protein
LLLCASLADCDVGASKAFWGESDGRSFTVIANAGRCHFAYIFFNVNFRMSAAPSLAIDLYNDFFSKHGLTYFC